MSCSLEINLKTETLRIGGNFEISFKRQKES